jgi:ceramide synthetase
MSSQLFNEYLPAKFTIGSLARTQKAEMLGERVFRVVVNIFCVISLYLIMRRDDCNFLDKRIGGSVERTFFFSNYPCQPLPMYLDGFYLFKLAYHLYELGYTIGMQRSRPDFPEYFLHHLITWSLIFFSYSLNMLPIGAAVMLLHDLTDLSVTLFKLTVDITPVPVQVATYILMLVSWVYLRLWYFTGHVILNVYEDCYEGTNVCKDVQYSPLNMLFAFLIGLCCLHIFWFYLMVKGLVKRFRSKTSFKDAIIMSSSVNRSSSE